MSISADILVPPEYTVVRPPISLPFLQKIGHLASNIGYSEAVSETFSDAGIAVELEGNFPTTDDGGLIIASNHLERLEPLLVQAALSSTGHDGSYVVAAPWSVAGRLVQATGEKGRELIIPVVRSDFGKRDRTDFGLVDRWRLSKFPGVDRPSNELRAKNKQAVAYAAGRVVGGSALTICPTGDINDAAVSKWHNGIGKIIQDLPHAAYGTTHAAVFEPKIFTKSKFLSALLLRDMGIHPKKQTIVLRAATIGTIAERFIDELASGHPSTASHIANSMREYFRAAFRADT